MERLSNSFEYKDIKDRPVMIGARWHNANPSSINTKITDPETKEILLFEHNPCITNNYITWERAVFRNEDKRHGISKKQIEFYKNGRLVPEKTFTISIDYGDPNQIAQLN